MLRALDVQAEFCERSGAVFTAAVARALRPALERGALAELLAPWVDADFPQLVDDAVSLRLLGALHALVLSGRAPELAAAYPPTPAPGRLAELAPSALERHCEFVRGFLRSPPQTNEVRRAFALLPGFLRVAGVTGLPQRTFEVGASAGLLSQWDRFAYDFGEGIVFGDGASSVRFDGGWRGPPPVLAPVQVVQRYACDLNPVSLADPTQALRLRAYVWAGQEERRERLEAAIALARAHPVEVERADAAAWVRDRAGPCAGTATVVFHSVMWQYLSDADHIALADALEGHGRRATADAPFAHLAFEPPDRGSHAPHETRLTMWPGGETKVLARAHPHAHWIEPVA